MPKDDYIKRQDDAFSAQLNTFKNNIGSYSTTLGVSAGAVTAQAADAAYFAYVLASQDVVSGSSQQWTDWKKLTRAGGTPPPAGAPVAPVLPTSVAAVAPGIEVRFRALVQQIKAHANYNTAIGEALGIEGEEQAGPDLMTLQPEIKAMAGGSEVKVTWGWQGQRAFLDAIEIQVDRGTGAGWQMLTIDTTPNYHDTEPFPATPARWKYRAIFRVGDQRVGQWSNEVGLNVGG